MPSQFSYYSFSEPLNSGIDFYTADAAVLIESNLLIESNVTINASKTSFAISNQSIESSVVVSAIRTKFAVINLDATVTTTTNAITFRIVTVSASLSATVSMTTGSKIILANIRIALQNFGAMFIEPFILFENDVNAAIYSSIHRTLIMIDGKPLTNHNRTLAMDVEPIFVENRNWNNRKNRYYKSQNRSGRKVFNLSWSWLPNSINYTVDHGSGRDFIHQIAADPRGHVLKIINLDESGTTPYTETSYNVLIKNYNETLIRRDLSNDVYFWDCSMSLEEV